MTDVQLDIYAEAEARKQQGMAQVDANSMPEWKAECDAAIERLARTGRVFQAHDLTLEGIGDPHHPNAWGARLSAAAKRGVIVSAGTGQSTRPTTAKSLVHLWRGAA